MTEAAPAKTPQPFPEQMPALTSVRFLLALGVVLFHYQLNMLPAGGEAVRIVERSRLGVDFFFILSGFVLAHVYGREVRAGTFQYWRFLTARFARIYPAHIAVLAGMAAVGAVALAAGQPFDARLYSVDGLIRSVLLMQAWGPNPLPVEWNGPSWSLSAEWAAYLAFPLFAWIGLKAQRNPWVTLALAGVLFIAADAFYRWQYGGLITHAEFALGPLRIAPEFLYGIGLYQLGTQLTLSRQLSIGFAAAGCAMVLVLMQASADERIIVAWAGVAILGLAMLSRERADPWAGHPLALEAGEASYALYLLHLPMLTVWKNGMALLRGGDSHYQLPLWEAAGLLALTVGTAFALHAWWERPARRWLRARLMPPKAVVQTA